MKKDKWTGIFKICSLIIKTHLFPPFWSSSENDENNSFNFNFNNGNSNNDNKDNSNLVRAVRDSSLKTINPSNYLEGFIFINYDRYLRFTMVRKAHSSSVGGM
jgi:hypothetical protein